MTNDQTGSLSGSSRVLNDPLFINRAVAYAHGECDLREVAEAAVKAMGDASTRKDEGCIGTTALEANSANVATTPLNCPSEISAVELIMEHLPSFGVGINNPNDIGNALYAKAIADGIYEAIRPYLRTTEPVSVSLEECTERVRWFNVCGLSQSELIAKAVLDAAGVKYE